MLGVASPSHRTSRLQASRLARLIGQSARRHVRPVDGRGCRATPTC